MKKKTLIPIKVSKCEQTQQTVKIYCQNSLINSIESKLIDY